MSDSPRRPEIEGISIVALGSFNPAIFQPAWFSQRKLIREEEAESADIKVIHKDVTEFSTAWFSLQVLTDRCTLMSQDPTKYLPLRDLVHETLSILEHTPVHTFGFNMDQHFRMDSEDEWHSFGHHYAPKASWLNVMNEPGMRGLTMEGTREQCEAARIQVRIEPSPKVHPGIAIHINEHHKIPTDDESPAADQLVLFLRTLQDSWGEFLDYCTGVPGHLFTACEKEKT